MKALVADDHPLVRDALARTLADLEPGLAVVTAADFDGALAALEAPALDDPLVVALVDWQMPGMHGLDGLRRLQAAAPLVPLVVVSGQDDVDTIRAVLAAGAAGFIPKSERPEVLLQALRLVRAGATYVPARLLQGGSATGMAPAPAALELTPRQRDVLLRLLRGEPNKLIARELGLTEGTVKIHIAAILRSLQVRNRTEAALRARELGLLPPQA